MYIQICMYLSVLMLLAPTNLPPKRNLRLAWLPTSIWTEFYVLPNSWRHRHVSSWNNSMESPNRSVAYAPSHLNICCSGIRITPKLEVLQMVNFTRKLGKCPITICRYCILVTLNWPDLMDGHFEITFADTNANLLGWESLRQLTSYILSLYTLYYTLWLQIISFSLVI